MTTSSPMVWIAFNVGVVLLLLLDAFVLNPANKEISFRRALSVTAFWVLLAMGFNLFIYYWLGDKPALEFLTGYVVEQSLSVDNIFVFLLIFSHFKVEPKEQRKILMIGIISAQVMRAVFILLGVAILQKYHWMMYIFGGILVYTGIKLFFKHGEDVHPEDNPIVKFASKYLSKFWIVLIAIETTDLIFAIDSIPAILAITKDPFIAYSSNIFAILGLRAMYFVLANFLKLFHLLHYGLGIILTFIGIKMITESFLHLPIVVTLGFIVLVLLSTVVASLIWPQKAEEKS